MRQRHGGPKIINWHRPMAPGELKRKYLRFRHAYLNEDHLITPEEWQEAQGKEFGSTVYDNSEMVSLSSFDLAMHQIKEKLSFIHEVSPFDSLRELSSNTYEPKSHLEREPLPKIVYSYRKFLKKSHLGELDISHVDKSVVNDDTLGVLAEWVRMTSGQVARLQQLRRLTILVLFSSFWIRTPLKPEELDWDYENLVAHLFEKYLAPASYRKVWDSITYTLYSINAPDDVLMYLCMAQGVSIRSVAKEESWDIPKRFNYYLFTAPGSRSINRAKMDSYILAIGGTKRVAHWVDSCRRFLGVHDPVNTDPYDDREKPFWRETILWLTRNEVFLNQEGVNLIMPWATHEHYERGRSFRWRGRTLESAFRAAREYQELLNMYWYKDYQWETYDYDWECLDKKNRRWEFIELNSKNALVEETRALKHCVRSYGSKCLEGESAIVRLLKNREQLLTIEVNPKTKEVIQIRGKHNRRPERYEMLIIQQWGRIKGLDQILGSSYY